MNVFRLEPIFAFFEEKRHECIQRGFCHHQTRWFIR
jgi:hypothetical protein